MQPCACVRPRLLPGYLFSGHLQSGFLYFPLFLCHTSCPQPLCHLHCLHVRLWLYFAARSTPAANPFLMAVHVGVFITPLHLINICITFCVPFPLATSRYLPLPPTPTYSLLFRLVSPSLLLVCFFAIRPENGHRFWL